MFNARARSFATLITKFQPKCASFGTHQANNFERYIHLFYSVGGISSMVFDPTRNMFSWKIVNLFFMKRAETNLSVQLWVSRIHLFIENTWWYDDDEAARVAHILLWLFCTARGETCNPKMPSSELSFDKTKLYLTYIFRITIPWSYDYFFFLYITGFIIIILNTMKR